MTHEGMGGEVPATADELIELNLVLEPWLREHGDSAFDQDEKFQIAEIDVHPVVNPDSQPAITYQASEEAIKEVAGISATVLRLEGPLDITYIEPHFVRDENGLTYKQSRYTFNFDRESGYQGEVVPDSLSMEYDNAGKPGYTSRPSNEDGGSHMRSWEWAALYEIACNLDAIKAYDEARNSQAA